MRNPQNELEASVPEPEVKFTTFGTREPSEEFFGLLDHFFPDLEAEESNFYLRYVRGKKGFWQDLGNFLKALKGPLERDVTIVIEDGALCSKSIDKVFGESGWRGKTFVGLFNCYCYTIIGRDHGAGIAGVDRLLLNDAIEPEVSDIRDTFRNLDGDLINRFFGQPRNRQPRNATAGKMPDSSYIPRFRRKLCDAFGVPPLPTLVIELANSQSLKSLFTAVISWICGSMLLVETVLAVDLWKSALTIDIWNFDCTVDRIEGLITSNAYRGRDLQCLCMVATYKARRWLIDLRLTLFLIDRENARQEGQRVAHRLRPIAQDIPRDVQGLFDAANAEIEEDVQAIRDLAGQEGPEFLLRPEIGLRVPSIEGLLDRRVQIVEEIAYYQRIVRNIGPLGGQPENELDGVHLRDAVLRVTNLLARNCGPPLSLGPVDEDFTIGENVHLDVPQKALTGYGMANVLFPNNHDRLNNWVRDFSWRPLGDCLVRGRGIRWDFIRDRARLERERQSNGRVNQARPSLNGWIELKHLRLEGLRAVYESQGADERLPQVPIGRRQDDDYFRWVLLRRSRPHRSIINVLNLPE